MATATPTKERPILLGPEWVRAILAGRKIQTRRPIEAIPGNALNVAATVKPGAVVWNAPGELKPYIKRCPFGGPGDLLWVREKWAHNQFMAEIECTGPGDCFYAATCSETRHAATKWRPSIHMPRWASRLTLEVLEVRVQHVQEIDCNDIRAEGLNCQQHDFASGFCVGYCKSLYEQWVEAWDSIYGNRGFAWADNPWCWAITFRRADV